MPLTTATLAPVFPREVVMPETGEVLGYSGITAAGEGIYLGYGASGPSAGLVLAFPEAVESEAILDGSLPLPALTDEQFDAAALAMWEEWIMDL